jgi:RNA polymerase sigma factor (sigma-70 family)
MSRQDGLDDRFETHRGQLRAVAYRMLGSSHEADDAVQEAWLRLARTDADSVENLGGWLITVVSRVCLDMLRSRRSRREELVGERPDFAPGGADPEEEALRTESVGRALLVVLDTLVPAERVAFVLHDMFAVPFDEIARVVDRTTPAAKKLASRARRKVRGTPAAPAAELAGHRAVVEAFLAASRAGDLAAVVAVLAPDVVRRADPAALRPGRPTELRGAHAVAEEIALFGRNARYAEPALVNGTVGLLVAPGARLRLALTFTIGAGRVRTYELIADPSRLARLTLSLLAATPTSVVPSVAPSAVPKVGADHEVAQ